MAENKNQKSLKSGQGKKSSLSENVRSLILGIVISVFAFILVLSFFEKAGVGGEFLFFVFHFLLGKTVFLFPFLLIFFTFLFFKKEYRPLYLMGALFFLFGISGSLSLNPFNSQEKLGGNIGYLLALPLSSLFGALVGQVIFLSAILIGILILFQSFFSKNKEGEVEKTPLFKKIFTPRFKVKEITPSEKEKKVVLQEEIQPPFPPLELKTEPITSEKEMKTFIFPPLSLLEKDSGAPAAGDINNNLAIIKKTLQNFGIEVQMGQVNIGPTVTQYTLKPAEGVKLSKITNLNNDLALALASHPIRIEAPIPGKSLVGIEIPNKVRAQVRMRDLVAHSDFQGSISYLTLVLGRDVTGKPLFSDLSRLPHLLVAGSTGTGKTICLNGLIISLLYKNSPETLRFILIDPKRVEFPIYNSLPHLLTPVIFDVNRAIVCLKWLTQEMERRFDMFAEKKTRDIINYNTTIQKEGLSPLPYIVLIIDELADLMAAKGREIEAGIVRLAQMARAVGIHLVLATQRPSVEVVTGLIKANITSRIAFQVASQIDSRTILDMGGAEKLLGLGDLLYISAETAKPRRIQAAYVSEKEVRRVVHWLKEKEEKVERVEFEELEKSVHKNLKEEIEFGDAEDSLYEEAKKVVGEARKASASLLQRRLRIGYARAARLLDILEERGVVGPGEGAKPREVYMESEEE